MTDVHAPEQGDLLTALEHAHRHTLAALDDPQVNSLAAVTWASAHLAAVARVLYPLAGRTLPEGHDRVRTSLAVDHRLQQALFRLDRRLTGDVHLRHMPVPALEDEVRRALRQHVGTERRLAEDLLAVLSPQEQQDLSDELATTLLRSPTRPHPYTRHSGLGGGLVFALDAVVDRARDSLDSRIVPTPHRTPVRRPLTRWGAYALGSPYETSQSEDRPSRPREGAS